MNGMIGLLLIIAGVGTLTIIICVMIKMIWDFINAPTFISSKEIRTNQSNIDIGIGGLGDSDAKKEEEKEEKRKEQEKREREEDKRKIEEHRALILKQAALHDITKGRNFFQVIVDILDILMESSIVEVSYIYINFICAHFSFLFVANKAYKVAYTAIEIRSDSLWKWKELGKFLNNFERNHRGLLECSVAPLYPMGQCPPLLDPRVMEIFNGDNK